MHKVSESNIYFSQFKLDALVLLRPAYFRPWRGGKVLDHPVQCLNLLDTTLLTFHVSNCTGQEAPLCPHPLLSRPLRVKTVSNLDQTFRNVFLNPINHGGRHMALSDKIGRNKNWSGLLEILLRLVVHVS